MRLVRDQGKRYWLVYKYGLINLGFCPLLDLIWRRRST